MSRALALIAAGLVLAAVAPALAQPRGSKARCLDLIAIYERHVAKNAAHPLPSVSVEMSVVIEQCREGKVEGGVAKLEAALRAKGFRP